VRVFLAVRVVDTCVVATFCLVHGAWHDPWCWEPVVERLRTRGHDAIAPDLPFHDPDAGFEQRVRPALQALNDVTGTVVVVGHSLGSGYSPLIAAARPGSLLVHLCPRLGPFAPPPGGPKPFRKGFPFPPDRPDGTSIWDADAAIGALYPRLPPATARALAQRLRPLAPGPGEYPLARHPEVPTVLVYAAQDEIFEPAWERFMATELLGIAPIEIPGGHFPMLEDPDALADLLDRLAREHAGPSNAAG
jgi:pimeloyl-ACP methyl ester carboxylesterase